MSNILELNNISVVASESGTSLLQELDCAVAPGSIHCILGKNGSGKTALAYSIMGLPRYSQTDGKIRFDGQDLSKLKTFERARLGLALAFQEPARFEGLTVKDFFQAGNQKAGSKEMAEALEFVGLEADFLTRRLDDKLSGGERKRIEIASVILMRPKLMILDEPDASLDIIVYNEFYELLLKIKKDLGCAILLITHREEAGMVADHATLIENGRAVQTADFRTVMRSYCHRMGRQEKCCRECEMGDAGC